jgi:hypothetical protein
LPVPFATSCLNWMFNNGGVLLVCQVLRWG